MAYGILTFARRLWNRRHVLFCPGAVRRLAHPYSAVPKGCGFTLQNRGSGFVLEDGHPNNVEVRLHHLFQKSLATDQEYRVASDLITPLSQQWPSGAMNYS